MTEKHVNDIPANGFFEILKKDHEYAMSEYLKKPNHELDSTINQLSDEEKFILMAMMIMTEEKRDDK